MGVGSGLQRGGLKALVIDQEGEHLVAVKLDSPREEV